MAVAVTENHIHLLAMPMVGGGPERELMRFERDQTLTLVGIWGPLTDIAPPGLIEVVAVIPDPASGDRGAR